MTFATIIVAAIVLIAVALTITHKRLVRRARSTETYELNGVWASMFWHGLASIALRDHLSNNNTSDVALGLVEKAKAGLASLRPDAIEALRNSIEVGVANALDAIAAGDRRSALFSDHQQRQTWERLERAVESHIAVCDTLAEAEYGAIPYQDYLTVALMAFLPYWTEAHA